MDEVSYEKGKTVSLTRRLVAYFIDWAFLSVLSVLIAVTLQLSLKIGDITSSSWWVFLEVLLYFMVIPYVTNGLTLGKKIVRIRVVSDNGKRLSFKALFIRYGYLYFLFYGLAWLSQTIQHITDHTTGVLQVSGIFIVLGVAFAQFIFMLNLFLSFLRKKRVLFYEKASQTHTISTIQPKGN